VQPERGPKRTIAWADVRAIEYFDAPPELAGGLASLAAGNARAALDQLELVLQAEGLRPVVLQEAAFNMAYCQQRLGQTAEALSGYEKVLADYPRGRYLRMLAENLIDLRVAGGAPDAAKAALDKLGAGAQGLPGADSLLQLLQGRLFERQGKFSEAQQAYTTLEASPAPEFAEEGRLGRARMLLRQNKGSEGEPLLRTLTTESLQPRVQSGAWNGIGELLATEGRSKKDAVKILDGAYAYLRTVVQYKPLPGESTDEYERALAGAATCFEYLSQLEPNAQKKQLWRERQGARIDQLRLEFPFSVHLKK
jgi:tetratricopeptide (TPR) repeat protein